MVSRWRCLGWLCLGFVLSGSHLLLAEDDDLKRKKDDDKPRSVELLPGSTSSVVHNIWVPGDPLEQEIVQQLLDRGLSAGYSPDDGHILRPLKPADRLHAFRGILEQLIIEQPEAIDALISMEQKSSIMGYGLRESPEILYLLGLPGMGKDTIVEAYAKVLHGTGSWRDHFHMLPIAKKEADLWRAFGSNTGYVGSNNISPLIKFLVQHSGGRYLLAINRQNGHECVLENLDWYPGMRPLPEGYFYPEEGILFANEFHNWSAEAKDDLLKQAIEKGYFPINNPNGGVDKIYVPITFVIASNEGIELLAERDQDGNPIGKSQTYDALLRKWERVHGQKERILKAIKSQRTRQIDKSTPAGLSEELANRIPKDRLVLLKPLSLDGLKKITLMKLAAIKDRLAQAKGEFGEIQISFRDEVADFVANYQYDAEEGARRLNQKIEIIEKEILSALYEDIDIEATFDEIEIGIKKNSDRTYSLTFQYRAHGQQKTKERVISITQHEKPAEPISDAEVERLASIPDELRKRVFGIDGVADRIGDAMLAAASRSTSDREASANIFFFLGLSSTGKTETAKAVNAVVNGEDERMLTIDFSQVQTMQHLKEKILGTIDPYGRPQKSPFMAHYDKYDGHILVVFDEIANAPSDILRGLYDIFREPIVTTFSDGEPRPMKNVTIIATGNAGESWFATIPRSAPRHEQQMAMYDIYAQAMKDPDFRRQFLENFFSEALLNRIGENNIVFFPPHTFESLRQLTDLKLHQAIERLAPRDSERGWRVVFASANDYLATVELVERDGFILREQGASIDRFVKQEFERVLRVALLKHKVPHGARVVLSFLHRQKGDGETPSRSVYRVMVEDHPDLDFNIEVVGQIEPEKIATNDESRIITAYHEAGHEIVRMALLSDKYKSKEISIIPGVANIGGQWVRYEGIAHHEQIEQLSYTREAVIQELAVMLAGEAAELLVTGQYQAGKSNDVQRATQLARTAILRFGLSEEWGNEAVPEEMNLIEYVQALSEERRQLLEHEVQKFLTEGRKLARQTLLANFESHFLPMGSELAAKGILTAEEIEAFYQRTPLLAPKKEALMSRLWQKVAQSRIMVRIAARFAEKPGREAQLKRKIPRPKRLVNIDDIIAEKRRKGVANVKLDWSSVVMSKKLTKKMTPQLNAAQDEARKLAEESAQKNSKSSPCRRRFGL